MLTIRPKSKTECMRQTISSKNTYYSLFFLTICIIHELKTVSSTYRRSESINLILQWGNSQQLFLSDIVSKTVDALFC